MPVDIKKAWSPLRARVDRVRESLTTLRRERPDAVRRVLFGAGALVVLTLVSIGGYLVVLSRDLPSPSELSRMGEMDQATAVFDARDQLAFTIFKEQRIDVPLSAVAPVAIDAIVSIEDRRFYSHHGFDWMRIGSAFVTNIRHGRVTQGASTITQQLARMSFLTPDRTLRRKVQELMLARRIERAYSKHEILQLYLNKAYFGDGLYGIEAAARGFFGKNASQLSVAEAALLAGLVKSPSTYAPTVRLERAIARRNIVLNAMLDNERIDRSQLEAARASSVTLVDGLHAEETAGAYFKEQVRQELVDRFGWQRVYQGGLRVYSTLDADLQREAERAVAEGLQALDARRAASLKRRGKTEPADAAPLQAALVAMDPITGHVRAMVGGRDYQQSRFNRSVQARRQPGSAFKPFVYAAALEAGFTPATVIRHLNDPIATIEGAWTPEDGHSTDDAMSMRTALRTSSNRAAVRMLQDVGIPKTVQYAKTMGVGDVPSVPSLALGAGEVTLQSMTAAYAGFANKGDVPKPIIVRRVEDRDGQVLFAAQDEATHAISATTAYLMTNMLSDVINAGTAAGVRGLGFTLPAAGKTGTTNDYHDAWFVGYTTSLVTGVWVGFDQPKTIFPNGYAADVAVPMWTEFMKAATKGTRPEAFRAPPGIVSATVCRLSGQLAGEGCYHADERAESEQEEGSVRRRPMVYTEYFAKGTAPSGYCEEHAVHGIIGAIAAVFTGGDRPTVPRLEEAAAATRPSVESPTQEPPAAGAVKAAEPPKKRGFWSRVFGRKDRSEPEKRDRDE